VCPPATADTGEDHGVKMTTDGCNDAIVDPEMGRRLSGVGPEIATGSRQPGIENPAVRQNPPTGPVLALRNEPPEDLTPQRIAEIREKILSGAYNSLDLVDELARRILISGDVTGTPNPSGES